MPPRTTEAALAEALRSLEPRLLARRPDATLYRSGWTYETAEMTFRIVTGDDTDGRFRGVIDRKAGVTTLFRPDNLNGDESAFFDTWVQKVLNNYAVRNAEAILLPLARQVSGRLGVAPASFSVSFGRSVLGRCDSRGNIKLSRNLVFYPYELRVAVIAHELAHLTHLNHSAAFHALLDQYLDGNSRTLSKQLRQHRLPFGR